MRFRTAILPIPTLALAACAMILSACNVRIEPRDIASCDLKIYPIEARLPGSSSLATDAEKDQVLEDAANDKIFEDSYQLSHPHSLTRTFEQVIELASTSPRIAGPGGTLGTRTNNLLFLSGGSHNGAYGAGFLRGWAEGDPNGESKTPPHIPILPKFSLVTGISTGSILATPAFLGDFDYPSGKFASIKEEKELLKPYVRVKANGDISKSSYLSIVKHSALADLSPLKTWLNDYINDSNLRRIALRAKEPAWLFVGVVDVESGKAVAIDLADLATQYVAAADAGSTNSATVIQQCYVDAIVASSSAPLAARPVFINNRTYVDGGVRYGVFATALEAGIRSGLDKQAHLSAGPAMAGQRNQKWAAGAIKAATTDPEAAQVFVIFHGTQTVDPWCDDETDIDSCNAFEDPRDIPAHPRKNWNLVGLGLRSIDLMVNQLQRFSVTDLEQKFEPVVGKNHFHYTQIYPRHLKYRMTMSIDGEDVTKTCEGWYQYDTDHLHPVQFHPRYMKCIVAAGYSEGKSQSWPVN